VDGYDWEKHENVGNGACVCGQVHDFGDMGRCDCDALGYWGVDPYSDAMCPEDPYYGFQCDECEARSAWDI